MRRQPSKPWTPAEDDVLARLYPHGGVAAVKEQTGRTKDSIVRRASFIGVSCNRDVLLAEPIAPVPTMTLSESLACIQFRKWGGPVNREQPMRWSLAA